MLDAPIPTNALRYAELSEELRAKSFLAAADVLQLPPSIVEYRNSVFGLQGDNAIMFCANTGALKTYKVHMDLGSSVAFLFAAESANTFQADGKIATFNRTSVIVSFNTRSADMIRFAGSTVKNLGIFIEPEALIDQYGLRPDALPTHVRSAMLGRTSTPARLMIGLSPRCKIILDAIFTSQMIGDLRLRYIRAKADELFCETVHQINTLVSARQSACIVSASERQRQQIEAAAHLYRERIGQMPSVDHLARLVGLNRNNITDGFKDVFGKTPGEYARTVRLEWAREQLREGLYTIREIASLAGYANASSLTRAYQYHFDRTPSQDSVHQVVDDEPE